MLHYKPCCCAVLVLVPDSPFVIPESVQFQAYLCYEPKPHLLTNKLQRCVVCCTTAPPPRLAQKDSIRLVRTSKLDVYPEGPYRVELRVFNSSSGRFGSPVWAPLCLNVTQLDVYQLSTTICRQVRPK